MTFVEVQGVAAGKRGYQIFGVSTTHKGVLAMRGTSPEKLAGRLAVFKRDGDTGVTLVDMQRVMHKTEAARILAASDVFLDMCVKNGHERAAVLSFLQGVAGAAAAVPVMPQLAAETQQEDTVQAQSVQEPTTVAVQEEAVQEEAVQAEAVQTEPDAAALLEQQEAADAGEEPEEESVEASRKARRRR